VGYLYLEMTSRFKREPLQKEEEEEDERVPPLLRRIIIVCWLMTHVFYFDCFTVTYSYLLTYLLVLKFSHMKA
jgi:hypothetical protein